VEPWQGAVLFLVGFGLVIPALEELLKPVGLVLAGQRVAAPMTAFVAGMLAGVGFGMTESLGNIAGATDMWAFAALTRIGTLIMHAFCSGLVGWGWGQARYRRRLARLALAYAGAVGIHGLWNGAAVIAVYGALQAGAVLANGALVAAGALLALLLGVCLAGLLGMGGRLRTAAAAAAITESAGSLAKTNIA